MVSNIPFIFADAKFVSPIVCTICGNNAHCIRREPEGEREKQTFQCTCGHHETRLRGTEPIDEVIQEAAEKRVSGGSL
jgi:hypothetical protein